MHKLPKNPTPVSALNNKAITTHMTITVSIAISPFLIWLRTDYEKYNPNAWKTLLAVFNLMIL